jgi:hypothetical protein
VTTLGYGYDNIKLPNERRFPMEQKLIQLLITLNKINHNLKCLSQELDCLNSEFIDEEFEKIFVAEQISVISPEDYD